MKTTSTSAFITVVGSVNMDLMLRCARLPSPGETVAGGPLRIVPGGKGANQAVAAARLGASVRFIGCVGDDDFGNTARRALAAEGIALSRLTVCPGTPTGVAQIAVDETGRNAIVLSAGANALLSPEHIDAAREDIEGAAMLVCQLESPLPAIQRAIDIAHNAGVPVLLNPAPALALPPELLRKVSLLVPNEHEALLLAGPAASPEQFAAQLRACGPQRVIVTLGERGVQVADDEQQWAQPAPRVTARDTTGAGDTFVGALAARLVQPGVSLREAIGFAQRAAAVSVTRDGAMASMPHLSELEIAGG